MLSAKLNMLIRSILTATLLGYSANAQAALTWIKCTQVDQLTGPDTYGTITRFYAIEGDSLYTWQDGKLAYACADFYDDQNRKSCVVKIYDDFISATLERPDGLTSMDLTINRRTGEYARRFYGRRGTVETTTGTCNRSSEAEIAERKF